MAKTVTNAGAQLGKSPLIQSRISLSALTSRSGTITVVVLLGIGTFSPWASNTVLPPTWRLPFGSTWACWVGWMGSVMATERIPAVAALAAGEARTAAR